MRLIQVLIFCLVARQSSAFLVDLGGVVKDVVNTASNIVSSGVQTVGNVFNTGTQAVATVWCSTVGVLIPCKDRPGGSSVAPLPIQCKAVADILFVLDASGSIGSTNFKRLLSFVSNLAASFTLGPNDVRVGEVVFSNSAQKWFHLKDYTDPVALYKAILDTPYMAGATYTDKALNLVADSNMFGTANGGRVNAPDVLVVITDGQSNNPTATAQAAARLRGQGVLIFVVGVGSTFFGLNLFQEDANNELLKLASSPDHVFFSNTYEVLDSVLYQLVQRTCRASGGREQIVESGETAPSVPAAKPACQPLADVIYILDSSGSIGPLNYQKQINFTTDLASNFIIGNNDVLFGAVIFSHVAQKWFDLKDNPTRASLALALRNTPYLNSTTKTDQALDLVETAGMFRREAGARDGSTKLLIVITDGLSDNPALTSAAADRIKAKAIEIITVGIGKAQDSELQAIASSRENVFRASSFDALKQIVSQVISRACATAQGLDCD